MALPPKEGPFIYCRVSKIDLLSYKFTFQKIRSRTFGKILDLDYPQSPAFLKLRIFRKTTLRPLRNEWPLSYLLVQCISVVFFHQ